MTSTKTKATNRDMRILVARWSDEPGRTADEQDWAADACEILRLLDDDAPYRDEAFRAKARWVEAGR